MTWKLEHLPIAFTAIAAGIVTLFYAFRFGFFAIVGFDFADEAGGWNAVSNAGVLLSYIIGLAFFQILLAMFLQFESDRGKGPIGWLLPYSTFLQIGAALASFCLLACGIALKQPGLGLAGLVLAVLTNIFLASSKLALTNTIALWDIIVAILTLLTLFAAAGAVTASAKINPSSPVYSVEISGGRNAVGYLVFSSPNGIILITAAGPAFINGDHIISLTRTFGTK